MGDDLDISRAKARRIVATGLGQVAAGLATARSLAAHAPVAPAADGRRLIIAAGLFARDMALAALAATGPCETLIVTTREAAHPVAGARVFSVGWPDADAASLRAASAVEAALGRLGGGDAVLLLLSAGAERMLLAPAEGIAPQDLAEAERLMRAAGAEPADAMLVRQQLSRIEGGGLLRMAPAAAFTLLAVADGEVGEDQRRVAGGMAANPLGSRVTARALVELYGLWERMPERIRRHLSAAPPMPPAAPRPRVRLVASNAQAVAAMAAAGARAVNRPLGGGSLEILHDILAAATGLSPGMAVAFGLESWGGGMPESEPETGRHVPSEPGGPDDTLTLTKPVVAGAAGPRHADLALRFALLARDRRLPGPWALILTASAGDGGHARPPGVCVDSGTLAHLGAANLDAETLLARGRAMDAVDAIGAGVGFGATGTDVGDVGVFVRG